MTTLNRSLLESFQANISGLFEMISELEIPLDLLPEVLQLILQNPTADSIPALTTLFKNNPSAAQDPSYFFKDLFEWIFKHPGFEKPCIDLLEQLLQTSVHSSKQNLKDIAFYTDLLSNNVKNEYMLEAWGIILIFYGSSLHRTTHLNILLNLAEGYFNSANPVSRVDAFQCWKRLIVNFSFGDHLYHHKRIKLIMIPIINCLNFEKSRVVREACLGTFCFLLVIMGSKRTAFPDLFKEVLEPCFQVKQDEYTWNMLGIILSNAFSLRDSKSVDIFQLMKNSLESTILCIPSLYTNTLWSKREFESILQFMSQFPKSSLNHECIDSLKLVWFEFKKKIEREWIAQQEVALSTMGKLVAYIQKNLSHPGITSFASILATLDVPDRTFNAADIEIATLFQKGLESVTHVAVGGTVLSDTMHNTLSTLKLKIPSAAPAKPFHKFEKIFGNQPTIRSPLSTNISPSYNTKNIKSPLHTTKPNAIKPMERQLKKQKTEYVEIPLKPKPMLPLMTTHQLERNDSVTTKDLQKMYNTLVPSSQPDPPSTPIVQKITSDTTSPSSNSKNQLKLHLEGCFSNLDELATMDIRDLVVIQRQLSNLLNATSERISLSYV